MPCHFDPHEKRCVECVVCLPCTDAVDCKVGTVPIVVISRTVAIPCQKCGFDPRSYRPELIGPDGLCAGCAAKAWDDQRNANHVYVDPDDVCDQPVGFYWINGSTGYHDLYSPERDTMERIGTMMTVRVREPREVEGCYEACATRADGLQVVYQRLRIGSVDH